VARFFTEHDRVRARFNVYMEVNTDSGSTVRRFMTRGRDGEPPMIKEVPMGNEPPLWDWFPEEIAADLAEALAPRPQATERHLDDAIDVRDRLLTLVERAGLRVAP
jgi:hypothetical protein